MRVFDRTFATAQRIGREIRHDFSIRVWVTKYVLFSLPIRQVIGEPLLVADVQVRVGNTALEGDLHIEVNRWFQNFPEMAHVISADATSLVDARLLVYHDVELVHDSSQAILAQLANGDLLQVIGRPAEHSFDSQQHILAQLSSADVRVRVLSGLVDGDLLIAIRQLLSDADLQIVTSSEFATDTDVRITVAQWLGDRDGRQTVGEIVRQESHVFH